MENSLAKNRELTYKLVGTALLTAIVVVLQLVGGAIKIGTFSISLVLMPIVVGAALFGMWSGAWLGFVFGVMVLATGDAALFLGLGTPFCVPGTIITVLLKGTMAGLGAAAVYRLLESKNKYVAVLVASIVSPVVNTLLFFSGCLIFFFDGIQANFASGENVMVFIIVNFIGINFILELAINLALNPVIVRIVDIGKKTFSGKTR